MSYVIRITAEAEAAIRSRAQNEFTGVSPNADGTFSIELSWETIERLNGQQHAEETLSDCILRICATAGKEAN